MRSVHSLPGHDEPQVVEVPDLQAGPGQVSSRRSRPR
jgi:hypothetical protein